MFSASDADLKQVTNPDEIGMGHGKMGWLVENPCQFWSSAADRNKGFIGDVLSDRLGSLERGTVLEIGSGSGQHVSHFASVLPKLTFLPTEYPGHPNPAAAGQELKKIITSITAYTSGAGNTNVDTAQYLDASKLSEWDAADGSLSAIIAVNIIHISPKSVMDGLLAGSGLKLAKGGWLFLYGPYAVDGKIEPESNVKFHSALLEKDSGFGLRDINEVEAGAAKHGMELQESLFVASSNNYVLCVRKM
jgi:hypothetical protein